MKLFVAITTRFLRCLALAWFLAGNAVAQPAARVVAPADPQAVGASEIFDALNQSDAPSDLQRLRSLRDAMAGNPDAKTLNDMRAQVDALLRDAEHRQGELPPALVMSGIASRIDSAMTRLESARPAPPIAAFEGPPWLLPALAALAVTLAIGLALCLAALVAQGRSAEESDELREALTKIRRRLEDRASGGRRGTDDLSDDAAKSLLSAAVSINRIGESAKEAEAVLRASTESAEQRLQGAVAVAGRLETWLEELPLRLADAIGEPDDSNIGRLDGAAPLSDRAFLLPGFLRSMQDACEEMRLTTETLAQANLAAARLAAGESAENAVLASEMINLSFGHALKLDDAVTELARATEGLPELGRILAEAMAQWPLQLERNEASASQFEAASARAEAAWSQLGLFIDQALPEKLGDMAEAVTTAGIAALGEAATKCADVANQAMAAVAVLPESLREAMSVIGDAHAPHLAALAEAAQHLTQLTETLPETSISLAASAEALKRHVARDTRREAVTRAAIGEISAAAQSARADLAATAEAVSAMPAQNDRLSELLTQGEQLITGLQMKAADEAEALQRARTTALEGVELAIAKMQMAAERLHAGAAAQEQALARVRRAALTVATLAGASSAFGEATIIEPDAAQAG